MKKKIFKHIYQHIKLINENQKDIFDCVEKITKEIKKTLKNKKTIFFAGNGGSAADCEHLAGELIVAHILLYTEGIIQLSNVIHRIRLYKFFCC